MWVFTYVGALFNGLTLLILGKCLCYTPDTPNDLGKAVGSGQHWEG